MNVTFADLVDLVLQHDGELEAVAAGISQLRKDTSEGVAKLAAEERAKAFDFITRTTREMTGEAEGRVLGEVGKVREFSAKEIAEAKSAVSDLSAHTSAELARIKENELALSSGVRELRSELGEKVKEFANEFAKAKPLGFVDLFKGTLAEDMPYRRGDIFYFQGGTYIALKDGIGDMPSVRKNKQAGASWATIAAPGQSASRGSSYSASPSIQVGGGLSNAKVCDGGMVTLAQNDYQKAVTFAVPFTVAPAVCASLVSPDANGGAIAVSVDYSTLSTSGVTLIFGAYIPASGWRLSWQAVGT